MSHFGRVLSFGVVVAIFLAGMAPDVAAQKKKDKDGNKDTTTSAAPADYKYLQKAKDITGIIISVNTDSVSFKTDTTHVESNPKYKAPKAGSANYNNTANQLWRTSNDLQRQYNQMMTTKNPKTYAQSMQRYQQDLARYQQQSAQYYNQMMNQYNKAVSKSGGNPNDPNYQGPPTSTTAGPNDPFMVVHAYKEYELEIQEKAEYRKLFLPFEFDDAGNPRKFSDKEKAELRGEDKSKPGYIAKADEATAGTEAKFHLTPPKKKDKEAAKDAKDAKDAKGDDEVVERPTVNMIVLTKESPNAGKSPPEKKKKDKK